MNPLIEKYEELKRQNDPSYQEESNLIHNLPDDYRFSHLEDGVYHGENKYDTVNSTFVTWNGNYWEGGAAYNSSPYVSGFNINPASPITSVAPHSTEDIITFNTSIKPSLMIDGKDIKDVIKDEVKKAMYENTVYGNKIVDDQTRRVLDVMERVKKGEIKVKSYVEQISYDLGGSTTYYTIELEGN